MLLHLLSFSRRLRYASGSGIPPITAPWPTRDVVYVSIVGGLMLAALLEWLLWLLAFLYCLCKVMMKAEGKGRWGIRLLALANIIFFVVMRLIFLPVMIATLPLPSRITQYFPEVMVGFLQWFAFWSFAALLMIPWLFCVYSLVTNSIGRQRRIKHVLDEYTAPKMVIVMPCYNEEPEILLRTVDSIVDSDYPATCQHVFLSFDGDAENDLYLNTIEKLGVPLTLDSYPKSIDVMYRNSRITVSRFPHGGKRSCQKKTFKLIDKVYSEYLRRNDNLFILFIDSDCILDKLCIQNFMYEMELKPGSKGTMLAMTGVITSTTVKNSLITVLQDMEYIHGQLFERSVESACGAVTCLPGALSCLRFSAFRKMAKYYFADKAEQCEDLFDYGKCHLGEDRWLTHLFMIGSQERYQIQMNTGAFCKTEAVQTFKSLLKQRRRWFLGFITNEACMLTDIRLWKRYPLLCVIRLANNTIRTTALLFFIMIISIITTEQKISNLPVGFIAVSLGLNWVLMLYFGAKLGRYKIMLYPLMFVLNPFFNWIYMVYGIFTAGQRTWGGPRADASKADDNTTPAEAIEQAVRTTGDELNVVPETFKKAALDANTSRPVTHVPLLPSGRLEGRFAPAEQLPGGWYQQTNDSGALQGRTGDAGSSRNYGGLYAAGAKRDSEQSLTSVSSDASVSIRRVESIFGADDVQLYHQRQAQQTPAGGANYHTNAAGVGHNVSPAVFEVGPSDEKRNSGHLSENSVDSNMSLPMHFTIPPQAPRQPPPVTRQPTHGSDDENASSSPERPVTASSDAEPGGSAMPRCPPPVRRPYNRRGSSAGPSPLARKSFTRLAADEAGRPTPAEVEVRVPQGGEGNGTSVVFEAGTETTRDERRGRRISVDDRGRRISTDRDGRKRLSKRLPSSTRSSRTSSR
ncbi:glycosyltransferase family 2 protein [Polychaeton citri CBS 116435]|uniref:chitin synthase n=1 Tax=Polychaeton citri CBS 116435 TaxID=1314669 RepID=A0A9P4UM71_9PEZI|nr:glycosyltransferase family 2 protein [Polychaeton citri CBS 116435]